jgi:quinol monooxygenase YgiN
MLIIAGTLDVDPARRDEFLAGRSEAMRSSRAESGCLDYLMMPDPFDPGRVRLFERWEDKATLAAHLAAQAQAQAAPDPDAAPWPVLAVDILQYEIASIGPLGS